MNKDLVKELVRVANSLDKMGMNDEASNLDKIARKIVVSKKYEASPDGDYRYDIDRYKSLFKFQRLQDATDLFNSVMKSKVYSNEQKDAFRKQAEGIRNMYFSGYDENWGEEKLTNLLNASPFTILSPGILSQHTDLKQFTDYWISNIQPKFAISDPRVAKWLSSKFLLYKKSVLEAQKKNKEQEDSEKPWYKRMFGK